MNQYDGLPNVLSFENKIVVAAKFLFGFLFFFGECLFLIMFVSD